MATPETRSNDFPSLTAPGTLPKIDSIFEFSDKALQELRLWLEMHPLAVPIKQVLGFNQFTPLFDTTNADQSTASLTYTNLGTIGPTLTQIPDGSYFILFGALIYNNTAAKFNSMSVEINGVAASDNDRAQGVLQSGTGAQSIVAGIEKSLANGGSNTITAKYKVDGGTGNFLRRWLVALKSDNA